ncbi:MAG: hypothetical protein JSV18_01080 [Candidatus Bathyarchaeota archaeon]|nr:MAG: hypothetical protein JSV18_01080 [Candidatus Bathyarchaeota archaeon]
MAVDSGPRLRKRRVLRRKDARRLREEAGALLGTVTSNSVSLALVDDDSIVYIFDDSTLLVRKEGLLFPALTNPVLAELPSIVVDMGAIPYVCNGADVMAPGIVEARGEFEEGSLVVIRDVQHGKALAVGRSLVPAEEMRLMRKGKAVSNLHHVGDKIWAAIT